MMPETDLTTIRSLFETKYADNIKAGLYDGRDLEAFKNNDEFLMTYIRHDIPAEDILHESMKWRKDIKVRDINVETFDPWMWEKGAIYFHNTDKDGHRIMNVVVRHHKRDSQLLPYVKKFFAHAIEKAFWEDSKNRIVVMFDMADTGLSNLDMEIIKYVMTVFKYYYPTLLAYLMIYEMPWIFNAAWKVVKAWLSADAVKYIKFVTKSDVQEYINRDQLPQHMGGTDKYVYKYIPEIEGGSGDFNNESSSNNNNSNRKKVTFADQDLYRSISNDSVTHDTNSNSIYNKKTTQTKTSASPKTKKQNRDENSFIGRLLTISPAEELEFVIDENGKESYDVISLTNTLPYSIAYKVKTTSPDKYRVRPSSGLVKSGSCTEVHVYLQTGHSSMIGKDKFLIMAMEVTIETAESIGDLWKLVAKENIMEHRLRCTQTVSDPDNIDIQELNMTSDQRLIKISRQLDVLQANNTVLSGRVKWLVRSQFLLFFAIIALLAAIFILFKDEIFYHKFTACSSSIF